MLFNLVELILGKVDVVIYLPLYIIDIIIDAVHVRKSVANNDLKGLAYATNTIKL